MHRLINTAYPLNSFAVTILCDFDGTPSYTCMFCFGKKKRKRKKCYNEKTLLSINVFILGMFSFSPLQIKFQTEGGRWQRKLEKVSG